MLIIGKAFAYLRYAIIMAVVSIAATSIALLVYGSILTYQDIVHAFTHEFTYKGAKELLLASIEMVDSFLLSTVLYIIAVGLYELFIHDLNLPEWLIITDIDMLKGKLIGVIIVMLAVIFLGQVLEWDGTTKLMEFSVSISLIILTLTYFIKLHHKSPNHTDTNDNKQEH